MANLQVFNEPEKTHAVGMREEALVYPREHANSTEEGGQDLNQGPPDWNMLSRPQRSLRPMHASKLMARVPV